MMDLELARSRAADKHSSEDSAPTAAELLSLDAWEHSYKGTNKEILVPLMLPCQKVQADAKQDAGGNIAGAVTAKDAAAAPANAAPPQAPELEACAENAIKSIALPANDPVAALYMEARESMGRVLVSNGSIVGSGFFINKDGLFSTLDHVTKDGEDDIAVETGDGQFHHAKVVAKDEKNDTVLLQVEKLNPKEQFHPVNVSGFGEIQKGEKLLACGFGEDTTLHCSPGVYDFSLQQKDIKIKLHPGETAPKFDPERLLVHAQQHTVNGDSGGLEFKLSDGSVPLLVDMTSNSKDTVSVPAERLKELKTKFDQSQKQASGPKPS